MAFSWEANVKSFNSKLNGDLKVFSKFLHLVSFSTKTFKLKCGCWLHIYFWLPSIPEFSSRTRKLHIIHSKAAKKLHKSPSTHSFHSLCAFSVPARRPRWHVMFLCFVTTIAATNPPPRRNINFFLVSFSPNKYNQELRKFLGKFSLWWNC